MFTVKFEFEKNILINKSISELHQILSDVNQWNNWSPWACLDPDAKIKSTINPNTHYTTLAWDGKLIGNGEMTVTNKTPNQIDYVLNFFKPFKSTSIVWFTLISENNSTKVNWGMKSQLPCFLFFMKKMMIAYMSADYTRGLIRLKDYCETGKIESVMSNVEEVTQRELYILGKREKTSIDQLGPVMTQIFDRANSDIETRKMPAPDGFISFYHDFNLINGTTDFTGGVFYYQKPISVPDYTVLHLNSHRTLKMTHQGRYDHLPTAWSKIFCYQRGNKIKLDKKTSFYEVYLNSAKMVAEKDILTELRLGIK